MRFIMALALLWITQLQATPSLLEEAELQAARDPVGYLQRLDASPQQDMELFHARALARPPWAVTSRPCWTTPAPAGWPVLSKSSGACSTSDCSRLP